MRLIKEPSKLTDMDIHSCKTNKNTFFPFQTIFYFTHFFSRIFFPEFFFFEFISPNFFSEYFFRKFFFSKKNIFLPSSNKHLIWIDELWFGEEASWLSKSIKVILHTYSLKKKHETKLNLVKLCVIVVKVCQTQRFIRLHSW